MRNTARLAIALGTIVVALGSAGRAHAVGYLVPTDRAVEPLAIRYHRVSASIRERVAETRVEQTFRNHTSRVLEATCKYFYPEKQHIRLEPANSEMAPILIPRTDWRETSILGIVVGVYRKI